MATVASIGYFKRYKMEADLHDLPAPQLSEGYTFAPWSFELLDAHAEILFGSFYQEIDSQVFPSLGDRQGSLCLMIEMTRKRGFLPEATWLLLGPLGACGTVQGMRDRSGGLGSIQNLGILPGWRGRGLGKALLLRALDGFRQAGLDRAQLEVTAQNDTAIRLYRRLGFRRYKTLYKAAPHQVLSPEF
ncbi:MAG TPA: N-acetyltransferase [Gemmataceae bacterium]|nr:N-acetyltransferase [Gemmataceae bacterium]